MGITGRYDFKGIQRAARVAIDAILAGTSWGAWILASPFKPVIGAAEDLITNYLANQGLIILNIGAVIIDGAVDQAKLDAALSAGILKVRQGRDKITPTEGAKIDADVVQAFDNDADLGATNARVSDVSSASLRGGSNPPL